MTHPRTDEAWTQMIRDFAETARKKLGARMGELEDGAVERGLSSLLSAAATLLLIAGKGRKRDGVVGAILTAAANYLAKHAPSPEATDG